MSFSVKYHPDLKAKDLPNINPDILIRIRKAIEERLLIAPHEYGQPLRKTLKGYWKIRVGDYRVVFKIKDDLIVILCICHRKEAYKIMARRQS
jgi:mRNA interferase RelE/StbE